jgi:S-disulfanyl-L-cysteine oxidoreductase SoxD
MRIGISELRRSLALAVGGLIVMARVGAADVGPPALGEPATPHDIETHDGMVFPDGEGLPPGRGSVAAGADLYRRHCVACHGERGRGGLGGELAGGRRPLTSATPDQNIGTYWPYATTLFDFIRRAMPMTAPGSLGPDEVYALTAYLLHENGIVAGDAVLDAAALTAIEMPNRDGFIWIDAPLPPAR